MSLWCGVERQALTEVDGGGLTEENVERDRRAKHDDGWGRDTMGWCQRQEEVKDTGWSCQTGMCAVWLCHGHDVSLWTDQGCRQRTDTEGHIGGKNLRS